MSASSGLPSVVHFIWYGNNFDRFKHNDFQECIKLNHQSFHIQLWVEAYSLMGKDTTLPEMQGYQTNGALAHLLDEAIQKTYPKGGGKAPVQKDLRQEEPLKDALAHIKHARLEFQKFFKDHRNVVLQKFHDTYQKLQAWCVPADKVTIHFLEDAYLDFTKEPKFDGLVDMISFERLARGGNFGSASDIARLLVLYTYGGIYCDHDTNFLKPFQNSPPPSVPGQAPRKIFRFSTMKDHAVTNAVIVSEPQHPALISAVDEIITQYQRHFETAVNLHAYHTAERPPPLAEGQETKDLPLSPFEIFTLGTTGPATLQAAMNKAFKDRAEFINRKLVWDGILVINSDKTWPHTPSQTGEVKKK